MPTAPPYEVTQALERGTSNITRRVEIYESDGITPWVPDPSDPGFTRLVDGSVSLDYGRDERRTLDLTLLNDDKLLRPNPNGGFWYDKVLKIFRGVTYPVSALAPAIAIIETTGATNAAYQFQSKLASLGFTRTDIRIGATINDLTNYDIIITNNCATADATANATLLAQAYAQGKSIVTIGTGNGTPQIPFITATSAAGAGTVWGITPVTGDQPVTGGWVTEAAATTAVGLKPVTLSTSAQIVSTYGSGPTFFTAIAASNTLGAKWFDMHLSDLNGTNANILLKNGINWIRNFASTASWESQCGEFLIDSISEDNFPHQLKVTGRDYTKRCLNSKIEKATTFVASTKLSDLIKALAINSGIAKVNIPVTSETLGSDMAFDRGTARWDIMKQAATTFSYDLYFDNTGTLVMSKFQDPSLSPSVIIFKTGPDGNLVSYSRSANDSRLYNHVCVYGDPAEGDEDRLPYFGEAINTDSSSPTNVDRIGDRFFSYASTFFTNDQQAANLANTYLKIHALESYDLNFGSITYPWLDVGFISTILDPDALSFEPNRYLLDTLTIPLGLGPMDMTAKRVTYVDDPNSGAVADDGS